MPPVMIKAPGTVLWGMWGRPLPDPVEAQEQGQDKRRNDLR